MKLKTNQQELAYVREKVTPGRNAKYKRILTELHAVYSEYVCERTTKFRSKISCDSRVINLQMLMTKYLGFKYSVIAITGQEVTLC